MLLSVQACVDSLGVFRQQRDAFIWSVISKAIIVSKYDSNGVSVFTRRLIDTPRLVDLNKYVLQLRAEP